MGIAKTKGLRMEPEESRKQVRTAEELAAMILEDLKAAPNAGSM
jgi:hypothetical protein